MTAIVGILNKQGIAIAADSAVTVTGITGHENRKIFNRANKIFTLSKRYPVGIAIYNSAEFMGIPWEIIIKLYREHLGNKSFPKLIDYQKDFINFLHSDKYFNFDKKTQEKYLSLFFYDLLDTIVRKMVLENPYILEQSSETNQKIQNLLENTLNSLIDKFKSNENKEKCPEFNDYKIDEFKNSFNDIITKILDNYFSTKYKINLSYQLKEKFKDTFFYSLIYKEKIHYTGLVFVGYGENEIFPQLISIIISLSIDNKIRYFIDEKNCASITDLNKAVIRPFAQTDVIHTFLRGIDTNLYKIFIKNLASILEKFTQHITKSINDKNKLPSNKTLNVMIENSIKEFHNFNTDYLEKFYKTPLLNAVSILSKEDLAEMAESLVYLTYLKKRITNSEESVGGPIDVAIISKGDGFIWIKRKHYFNPELNPFFFENYFNFKT